MGQEQTSLCDLQELFGIVRECGASAILRYLHSIEGALCFGDRGLAITYAKQRIRSEKNALGTEEIKHQLENFWCMIEYSRVAIEFLEMIDEWLYYFGRKPHSPFVKSRPSTYQPRSATALCYGPDQGG